MKRNEKQDRKAHSITMGIDVGSITTKAALMSGGKLLAAQVAFTGYNVEAAAHKVFNDVLASAGMTPEAVQWIVATGYGRKGVSLADESLTEIICHGAGAYYQNPMISFIIDIGGQDSKAILLGQDGKVNNFTMNDKCAAGTGRFLEVMARALEVNLEAFGELSLGADKPAKISSLCTVFAESEVISLIAKGVARENIIAGIHDSIGVRVSAMAKRVGLRGPVMMTGGVAKNKGVVKSLEEKLGLPIEVSPYAQVNGAIGAAYLAWK